MMPESSEAAGPGSSCNLLLGAEDWSGTWDFFRGAGAGDFWDPNKGAGAGTFKDANTSKNGELEEAFAVIEGCAKDVSGNDEFVLGNLAAGLSA